MEKVAQLQHLLLRSRRLPWLVGGLTLAILAGAVVVTTLQVRSKVREQIASRDAEVLYAVALLQYHDELANDPKTRPDNPAIQFSVLLKASQLKGVMGVRLFDTEGAFVQSFPPELVESELSSADFTALKKLRPVSHFQRAVSVSALFLPDNAKGSHPAIVAPLLQVCVPLHPTDGSLAGIAQFTLEGESIQREFSSLDRHLALQGSATFVTGGGLLTIAIALAFRKLRRAQQLLSARTDDLVKANQELALAAKSSALGSVTAFLIHGLKNPLAGLQNFVAGRAASQNNENQPEPSEWQHAVASTRRMQAMINEVVGLLREEETSLQYEVTLRELGEIVTGRASATARERQVELTLQLTADAVFPNQIANLMALILVNLVQNAIEATPAGKTVCLSALRLGDKLVFEVSDQGNGFAQTSPLFSPCRSAKEGGSGIGLALCKQLANHLAAGLELKSNTPQGCTFALTLSSALCVPKSERSSLPMQN